MVIIDTGLLVSALFLLLAAIALFKDFQMLKLAKKTIDELQAALIERDRLVLRLTHELERHGCDDQLLIKEARALCEPIELSNELKEPTL